jgi:hypothetical protein
MSWTHACIIAATFSSSTIAIGDFTNARPTLVADESSGGQIGQPRGQRDAESAGKMQRNKEDSASSGGNLDPRSKVAPQSNSASGSNLRMQQNSGGTPTNPESNRTRQGGGTDPLSDGSTIDPGKGNSPAVR